MIFFNCTFVWTSQVVPMQIYHLLALLLNVLQTNFNIFRAHSVLCRVKFSDIVISRL